MSIHIELDSRKLKGYQGYLDSLGNNQFCRESCTVVKEGQRALEYRTCILYAEAILGAQSRSIKFSFRT